ncbi:MAG: cysteine dioxygenase family protein [Fimbriimonadaceae bacterium]
MPATGQPKVDELIARIDEAVAITEQKGCCEAVKQVLEDVVRSGEEFIGAEFMRPAEGCYARRLLHKDPAGRYSVLVMVWDVGQGTALHDHAGQWCVECVYRGRIEVESYDIHGGEDDPVVDFSKERKVFAGPGEAGALIPPFEYHTIVNASDQPSVTIHVYAGELTWCNIFAPVEGGYRKQRKELCYTD